MNKTAIALAAAGIVGLSAIATPAPAQARPWGWGPGLAGGLIAGAAIGGLAASTAWGWGGPYGYGYSPAFYGEPAYDSFAYDVDYAPAYTSYAVEPAFYTRRFVRPAFGFWGGPRWHRWHRSFAFYSGPRWHRSFAFAGPRFGHSFAFYGGPRWHHRWHRF